MKLKKLYLVVCSMFFLSFYNKTSTICGESLFSYIIPFFKRYIICKLENADKKKKQRMGLICFENSGNSMLRNKASKEASYKHFLGFSFITSHNFFFK